MRKIFLLCILFLGFTTTQAQEKVQPIIGFDSLNSLLMSRLKFSNELVKSGRTAEISFNVKVDSTGRIKDIIGKTRKTDTINTDLPEQIIPILHSLEWNRSITEGSINFKFNFSDSIPKPAKAFAVKKKVVFLRPEDMTKDSPPVRAEIEASFKGGMDALLYYVRDSFNYPELSMKKYLVATLIFFAHINQGLSQP